MAMDPPTPAHSRVFKNGVDATDGYILEAQHGTIGPSTFEKEEICSVCLRKFKRSQVQLSGGKAYCLPFGHYREIAYEQGDTPAVRT